MAMKMFLFYLPGGLLLNPILGSFPATKFCKLGAHAFKNNINKSIVTSPCRILNNPQTVWLSLLFTLRKKAMLDVVINANGLTTMSHLFLHWIFNNKNMMLKDLFEGIQKGLETWLPWNMAKVSSFFRSNLLWQSRVCHRKPTPNPVP